MFQLLRDAIASLVDLKAWEFLLCFSLGCFDLNSRALEIDYVSSLPDDVLCHILSFLPTKQAAVTSVLSKRWLDLWILVPNLDIDDSVFFHPEEDREGNCIEIQERFVDFVDRLLAMQGDSPVNKFSLKCRTRVDTDCVSRWVCNVIRRGVSDLDLFTDAFDDVGRGTEYPIEMFNSRTLVNLKLACDDGVKWWYDDIDSAYFPMLKSLYIDSCGVLVGDFKKFVPSFPALEELRIGNMEWRERDITVSSPSIKKLTLHGTTAYEGVDVYQYAKSISFDTPNLLSLTYMDFVVEDYPLVNMKKLSVAHIDLNLMEQQIERIRLPSSEWLEDGEDDVVLRFGNVVKLMNGIQNVQKLSILPDTLEVLSLCCDTMPVFNNLKFLSITSVEDRGWQAMPALLRNCPHLETIILKGLLHHGTDKCGDACPCISREYKGRSMRYCTVKFIEIQGFRATMKEMEIIKHFLDFFPCLKEMKVYMKENDPTTISVIILELFELYNKLSSCNVQLLVSDYLDQKWDQKWIAQGI